MTCPLCHKLSPWEDNPWRPFCSERCQVTDLGAWATNRYRIPGPTLTVDALLSDSVEGDDDTEKPQDS
ncbi:MAG TPA: DNA gyrase inhibitor YacG [Nitrospiraceae bacterium]|nr:DNA gyrase inhibitor YacG [Nitrospiraceae bacterium]